MPRRLVNRAAASAGPSPTASRAGPTALPGYEPLAFPLDAAACRALGDISSAGGVAGGPYEQHLGNVVRRLGTAVGDMHERLRLRQQRLGLLRQKREGQGIGPEEARLEEHVRQLERDVGALTEQSERAVRHAIDQRAGLEDEAAVLRDLHADAAAESAHNARRRLEEDDAEAGAADSHEQAPASVQSVLDAYRRRRADRKAEYDRLAPYQRYAVNNDYAGFKKLWHDAAVGEDGPPLADASRWFTRDGQPVMTSAVLSGTGRGPGDAENMDGGSDDDVAVARETISLNCPLTLRVMDEPYSNRKCKHTFEKAAVLEYLSRQPAAEVACPQTGCSQVRLPPSPRSPLPLWSMHCLDAAARHLNTAVANTSPAQPPSPLFFRSLFAVSSLSDEGPGRGSGSH